MPQSVNLTRIGSRIKIDLEKVRDRIPGKLIEKLNKDPRGTVLDYKMTDGGGVGVVVKFNDGSKSWFFDNECGRG
ncbi:MULTISPECIES: DUF2862 domain-containing protein [Prochlorococcus]|uniref:cytochrome b6f subunit PetP n=1 Tax=Prochlorococcus TaxID=1218 RepID=UPI0005339FE5|nr:MULTISPECIES: DUF2862 domain-containing protein [Prochlorococcus]KGG12968.1 hypothetical protein EV05_0641 [Prochlorococcus sp. MIT 0601]